ncbi:MAG: hypothetical protein GXY33_14650 [Phycisphaerae bacterium]|nr:hypothetical protein [Phycisphaerae bacterium]
MNEHVLMKIAEAPAMLNILPMPAGPVAEYMRVLAEEGYPAIEILARPTRDSVRMAGAIYSGITFCPTGTMTLETLPEWRKVVCVGPAMESTFVPQEWLTDGRWDLIRERLTFIRRLAKRKSP